MLHFGLPFPFVFALFCRSGWNWPLSINSSSSLNVKITQDTLFTYLMNINPCQDFSGALTEQQSRVWRVLEITLDVCVCVRVMQFSIACHNCMQSAWQSSWAVMHELIISIVCSSTHSHLHVLKPHIYLNMAQRRPPTMIKSITLNKFAMQKCISATLWHCILNPHLN